MLILRQESTQKINYFRPIANSAINGTSMDFKHYNPPGELTRMTQFKDKSKNAPDGVNMGLVFIRF